MVQPMWKRIPYYVKNEMELVTKDQSKYGLDIRTV